MNSWNSLIANVKSCSPSSVENSQTKTLYANGFDGFIVKSGLTLANMFAETFNCLIRSHCSADVNSERGCHWEQDGTLHYAIVHK